MKWLPAGLLAGLVALTPVPVTAPSPVTAAPTPSCAGVWVVVDATALGGPVTTSCATSHATGNEALQSAGFETARQAGLLCQIDGRPDACQVTASGYWSYWRATPVGQAYDSWSYATVGPGSYEPRGGDAEGWVFGDGSQPPSELPGSLAIAPPPDASATSAEPTPAPASSSLATSSPASSPDVGSPTALIAVAGVVVVAALGVVLVRRRAR